MNTHVATNQMPLFVQRLDRLRKLDSAAHAALIEALPWLTEYLTDESEFTTLADIVAEVAGEAPETAGRLAERVKVQPEIVADIQGFRRWVIHGLKHRSDSTQMLRHFETSDPLAFADHRASSHTEHLLRRREALCHYIAGFGFDDMAIDLHEPISKGVPQPSLTVSPMGMQFPRRFASEHPEERDILYRAMLAHAAAHLRFSPLERPIGNRRPNLVALTALIEDARVERLMLQEHPGLHAVWDRFHAASKEKSGFDLAGLMARLSRALHDPTYDDPNPWVQKGRELFEEAAAENLHDVSSFDRLARELTLAVGKMRLQLPRHYRPSPIFRDDNSLLWGEDQALPVDDSIEPEIESIEYRPAEEVPAEQDLSGVDPRRRYRYPEWDHQLLELREEWTTVLEDAPDLRQAQSSRAKPVRGIRESLKGSERIPDRSIRLKRLPEGDDLDLNAVIDNAVEQRAGIAPDGRIFGRHGRRPKSTSIIVLMDLSVSTDRFVPGSFTRVIDLEKQAAVAVTEALDSEHNRVAVHGFASNGRHEVNYYCVKGFNEPFDDARHKRLEGLTSRLSTRMGAALRHAGALLEKEISDNKIILLLTDGEPSDIDVVDEDYLIEDAHNAVVTAAAKQVRTFCLTLDRRADDYVRRIFGSRNYLISERASTFTDFAGSALVRMLAP